MVARKVYILLSAALLLAGCSASKTEQAVQILPDEIEWQSNPKMHSLQTATLIGDPSEPAPYVQRIMFPPNFKIEPHRHPNTLRRVTVLSGKIHFAFGETFDKSKLREMPAGSFFTEPANKAHYAETREEGVLLELHAVGPDGTEYVK
ncbi:cupin domain-containing protein [Sedimentisphaera salicampi]|uniref:Cupin type-2 domain-containing protein n=1 Tax=Sedimentisphaera salicampi TaxID=1941349 RepID=A0A1W6LIX2_9BACT|nr:cupin domain-containing protein [Sedimentisphaera salicampi]ARN55702.1 hypothetical protein STSP1_00065 [Sedimentisphaera salicampi]OXU16123.1 hypothetical protein SMSP1_00062 [Sedimentisphaera salicampi]